MTAPRIISGEKWSDEFYNSIEALRSTSIKVSGKSLFHFKAYTDGLITPSAQQQKGWDLGRFRHSAVLEKNIDGAKVFPNIGKYSKPRATKEWFAFQEENPNHIVITQDEYEELAGGFKAFWSHPEIREMMSGCQVEVIFCALCAESGLWGKCKTDIINLKDQWFGDFKACPEASDWAFARFAARARYPIQIGMYSHFIELATGVKMKGFRFFVQEIKSPYYTDWFQLSDHDFTESRHYFHEVMNKVAVAHKENVWPGYSKRDCLVLPPWAYQFEDAVGEGGFDA